MKRISEADWKLLRSMQAEKVALVCDQILVVAEDLVTKRKGNEHQAFLNLLEEANRGNELIAELFDDVRRSNAFLKLNGWNRKGLLSDEEIELFSDETQQVLSVYGQ